MKEMLNKYKYIVLLLGISLVLVGTIMGTSFAKSEFTREELEEMVTSTALSYYYNGKYSDYSQKSMDNATGVYRNSVRYRNLNLTPESINRNNQYFIDCSSFVSSVYMHSLGYDFSDYYAFSNTKYLKDSFNFSYTYQSKENFKESNMVNGSGINTAFFNNFSSKMISASSGDEYINNSGNSQDLLVYYYQTTSEETLKEQDSIIDNIKSVLRRGDILIYRHTSGGHAIMYVGGEIDGNTTRESIIHSNGGDFKELYNSVKNGSMENIEGIFTMPGKDLLSVMVLRPINEYCILDNCSLDSKYGDDSLARVDLKKLRTEAYTSTKKEYETELNKYIGKYNSVNNGDYVTYNFELENMSNIYFCTGLKSSGGYHEKDVCEANGGVWRKNNGEVIEYIGNKEYDALVDKENTVGLTIEALIPDGTTFASCVSCRRDGNKIIWDSFDSVPGFENKLSYKAKTFSYTVRVNTDDEVIKNEMRLITSNNNFLTYDSLDVKVNPTLTKENINGFDQSINKIKKLYNEGKLLYNSNSDNPLVDIDNINSISLSGSGVIKLLYYNELGIDLTMLTNSNIKDALFEKNGDDYAVKKQSVGDSNQISAMLVPGLYGGSYLRGNANGDRLKYIRTQDLEYGDILVYYTSTSSLMSCYLYLGMNGEELSEVTDEEGVFLHFGKNGFTEIKGLSAHSLIHDAFSSLNGRKDLLLVLRPTRLMGSTVIYNPNNNERSTSYVAYQTYRNLKVPSKKIEVVYKDGETVLDKDSYTSSFLGWYKDKSFKEKIDNSTSVDSKTLNIYALWDSVNLTLKDIKKDGYVLEGYYEDDGLTKRIGNKGDVYRLDESKTLYANFEKKKVTVTFNTNGGSKVDSATSDVGSAFSKPSDPVKDGYIFAGWYLDEGLTKLYTFSKFPEEDLTLYAKWTRESYTIDYVLNGGINNPNNQTSYRSGEVKTLYDPERAGYNFAGWFLDEAYKNRITVINHDENLILYAKWEKKDITISFETSATIVNPVTGKYQEKIDSLPIPERVGYRFVGWYDKDFKNEINLTSFPDEDVTLYAKWDIINYIITCQIENSYVTKTYNVESEFTLENPEKKGYKFTLWTSDNEMLNKIVIKKGTTGNRTYKANFTPIKYYVVYDPNGGSGTSVREEFTYDKLQGLKKLFSKDKYTFVGWHIDKNAKNALFAYKSGEEVALNLTDKDGDEIVLYAIWNKEIIDVRVNVINGTIDNDLKAVKKGEDAVFSINNNLGYENPSVTCTNNQTGSIKNNTLTVEELTDDTVCTVKYEKTKYKITYDLDGGVLSNGIYSYTVEDNITLPIPEKVGYEFIGWTTGNEEVPVKDVVLTNETGDKLYKANYKIKTYQITYTSDEYGTITGIKEEVKKYRESPSGTTCEIKPEYKLLKWTANWDVTLVDGTLVKKGDSLTLEQIKNIVIDNDIVFKAIHYITKYKITYIRDDNSTITGIESEEVSSGSSPLGTVIKPKQGYRFTNFTIDKDVTLVDGSLIKMGEALSDITKVVVKDDLVVRVQTILERYNVNYISDKNSTITGKLSEKSDITKTLNGTKYKVKQGYKLVGFVANCDVILNNKVIKKGTIINIKNLTKIKVKADTIFKLVTKKVSYTVKYVSLDNVKIIGKESEKVLYNENPVGTKVKVVTNENSLVWVANKDVVLKNGRVIKKGNRIKDDEVKRIVIKEDLTLKAMEKVLKGEIVPDTNSNISSVIVIVGTILITVGGYFLLEKRKISD